MSITYTNVYDDALLKIGNPPLDSGDVTSDLYVWLTQLYPRAVRQVLFDYQWGCQMRREILTQDTVTPAFGFDYRYALPYDCLRVLKMYPEGYTYSIENQYLMTDLDNTDLDPGVGVLYIANLGTISAAPAWVTLTVYEVGDFVTVSAVTYRCDTAHTAGTWATDLAALKWSATSYRNLDTCNPLLVEAITCKLAYMLTYKVVQSANRRQETIQEYEWCLMRAKQTDAMMGSWDDEGSTEWVDGGRT